MGGGAALTREKIIAAVAKTFVCIVDEGKADIGYTGDHTGDNISLKNANYCELTGLYWAWKNLEADYIGLIPTRAKKTSCICECK